MEAALKRMVRERADHRCEYCRHRQEHETSRRFHIEHVIACQHGGTDDPGNLALACQLCNLLKGPNLTSRDPDKHGLTRLFHPRQDRWEEHFRREGPFIHGATAVGRTTVWLLDMNCPDRVGTRLTFMEAGELD